MAHAYQPAGPLRPISPRELKPGRKWYLVALGVFVILLAAGGVTAAVLFAGIAKSAGLQDVSTQQQVTFEAGKRKVLFVSEGAPTISIPTCQHKGPGQIQATPLNGSETVTINGETWNGIANLRATQPGTYTVSCTPPPGAKIAVGNSALGTVGGIFGGLGALFGGALLGLLIGGTIAIVTLVKRSGHKTSLQRAATAPATGPGGFGPGPGPGGFGPGPGPGFGGPQPPAPGYQQPGQPGQPPAPGQQQQPGQSPQPGQQQPGRPPQPGQPLAPGYQQAPGQQPPAPGQQPGQPPASG